MKKVELKCRVCGKAFERTKSEIAKRKRKGHRTGYCSRACSGKSRECVLPDSIKAEYQKGKSTVEIAARFGCSDETVRRKLHLLSVRILTPRERQKIDGSTNRSRKASRYNANPDDASSGRLYTRAFYAQRRKDGMCVRCKDKAIDGKAHCQRCKDTQGEYIKSRLADGLCIKCNTPAMPGNQRCEQCAMANRKRRRAFDARVKKEVFERYGGFSCVCCGITEEVFLNIDHVKGGGSEHRKQPFCLKGRHFYRWLRKQDFPKGFQVLCFNCNFAKWKLGKCPHQIAKRNQ